MVKSHEIKAAWDRREAKRKGRVDASKPSVLPQEFNIRTPSAANILSILLGDDLPKDLPFMVRDASIRMEGRPLKPAFVVDELTGATGINADFVIWDEVAEMEGKPESKPTMAAAFANICKATAQTTKAFSSMSDDFTRAGKISIGGIFDNLPTGGLKHGELSIISSGRQVGKSSFAERYRAGHPRVWPAAATVMTPEQMESSRLQKQQAELEQVIIEAEREQLGYGGW